MSMTARSLVPIVVSAAATWPTVLVFGQAVTVQQPVVEAFSVGTSVSVPDRGEVFLGGVGWASETATANGFPARRGAFTRSTSTGAMSARVFVHDFDAMDAAVLNAALGTAARPVFTKSRYDDATSYAMAWRQRRMASSERPPAERAEQAGLPTTPLSPAHDPDRFISLGASAEREGKPELAVLHYRRAAKYGSAEAARRLAELGQMGLMTGNEP